MTRTALILGASGRFGSAMAHALETKRWRIRRFNRDTDDLMQAAQGVDVIINGWNPPYDKWQAQLPDLTRQVIAAAQASGARVVFPGNVYVYGQEAPEVFGPDTLHAATNPLGKLRIEIEAMYRAADVPLLILRAGDYIDTEMSGNWFDRIITKPLAKGRIDYPGPLDVPHAWAFLPDLARAGAALLDTDLPPQADVLFPGYTLTGTQLADALSEATGRTITARPMGWGMIRLGALFAPFLRGLVEMRYLWRKPHSIDATQLADVLPAFPSTELVTALRQTAPVRSLAGAASSRQGRDSTLAAR